MGIEVQYSPIFQSYYCVVFGEKRAVLYGTRDYETKEEALEDAKRFCDANGINAKAERKPRKKGLTPPT